MHLRVPERGLDDPLVFGWDRSNVGRVEVWLRRPRAGRPSISVEQKSALAAADGGTWGWLQQQRRPTARAMPRLRAEFQPSVCSTHVGSPRAAIGEQAVRRRTWRRFVSRRSAGERAERRARVAGTHRPNGATAAIDPDRSRLNAVSSWSPGLLITDSARIINSEIALFCGRQGAATRGGLLVASGGTHEEFARLLEGGLVGHALGAKRVALEPLDPFPGDRRVGAGAPPRADRATTRRRARRPRAWGEARGLRTTQWLPLRSQTRGGA